MQQLKAYLRTLKNCQIAKQIFINVRLCSSTQFELVFNPKKIKDSETIINNDWACQIINAK